MTQGRYIYCPRYCPKLKGAVVMNLTNYNFSFFTKTLAAASIMTLITLTAAKAEETALKDNESAAATNQANNPEHDLWEEIKKDNELDDYKAYLDQYPKGTYSALAKIRIKKLESEAAVEQSKKDQEAWNSAKDTETENSYQSYLDNYPHGNYAALAQSRIKKLHDESTEQTDSDNVNEKSGNSDDETEAWNEANSAGTEHSYTQYLETFPHGRHEKLAKKLLLEEQRK
jgi:hypothetical protein